MSHLYLSDHATPLRVPRYCYFDIPEEDKINYQSIKIALIQKGVSVIKLRYSDDEAKTLQNIVNNIGKAHEHDQIGRIVWDVRVGGQDGSEKLAISHSDDEFAFHNDCAFELKIPDYIGLYVLHADIHGGGYNVLIDVDKLFDKLSKESFSILSTRMYKLRVPEEFKKTITQIYAPLIDEDHYIRYRSDVIDREACDKQQLDALNELELQMSLPDNMSKLKLNNGEILLLDNRRYLHARTKILDTKRHLKRVRFNMPELYCA